MAIQPIDLQTMYSQMANVAQNASRIQDAAVLSSIVKEQNIAKETLEQSTKVKEATFEETQTMNVKNDSSSSASANEDFENENKKKNNDKQKTEDVYESYIGQHVNITR